MKKYFIVALALVGSMGTIAQNLNSNRIRPYAKNKTYWQYEEQPVLLLGGSNDDNHFQWTGSKLTDHLDLMVSAGGNYIRNTMSDRDEGNVFAFREVEKGIYDLNIWNEEYWERLNFFLEETAKRDIIVHLTLWDQYDIRGRRYEMKDTSPWNPERNINYTEADGIQTWEDFFHTAEKGNGKVLSFQQRFVNRVLDMSLEYGHVIYNICNEGFTSFAWDNYWAQVINETANVKGIKAQVTAMQIDAEATVRLVLGAPELYTFADISQNNQDALGTSGTEHMDKILRCRRLIDAGGARPINNVKIYGSKDNVREAGSETEAIRRFWRNIFGGCAAVRFHRSSVENKPSWGMGLTESAQKTISAARMFSEEFNVFNASPLPELINSVSASQAYCIGNPGVEYAIYLPEGGSVVLDPFVYTDEVEVRWFDVENAAFSNSEIYPVHWSVYPGMLKTQKNKGSVLLTAPTNDVFTYRNQWIVWIKLTRNNN